MKPEKIVEEQLSYYNQNDLEGFCNTYADDIEIYDLSTGQVMLSGKNELREKYQYRFDVQKVKAEIVNRIVIGNKVIDHEEVYGIKENQIVKAVAIYEIKDNLISRVNFIFE